MKNANINSKDDAVTKDMVAGAALTVSEYHFPTLGVTVKAATYAQAFEEAKKQFKSKNKK